MKIVVQGRQMGKTTKIIELAAKDDLYIVCPNRGMARNLFELAKQQGKAIRMPITWDEFITKKYYGEKIKGFAFDELGLSLRESTNVPIKMVTMSVEEGGDTE